MFFFLDRHRSRSNTCCADHPIPLLHQLQLMNLRRLLFFCRGIVLGVTLPLSPSTAYHPMLLFLRGQKVTQITPRRSSEKEQPSYHYQQQQQHQQYYNDYIVLKGYKSAVRCHLAEFYIYSNR